MKKWLLALVFFALSGASLDAQTVAADRFRLNPGPCYQRAGSGSPEGVIAGNICDEYVDIDTNDRYEKVAGAAGTNTGWRMQVGPSASACDDYDSCVAMSVTSEYLSWIDRLRTDPEKQLRRYVDADGARLQSYDGSGYRPLWLQGEPVQLAGGGVVVGAGGVDDPGLGNMQVRGFIGAPGFVSQTDKWRIDAAGGADFRYLFTDELHAKAFIADLEQALAGGQIITKSVAVLAADFTVPSAGNAATLVVEDLPSAPGMAVFESGDLIRLRTFARASGELSISDAWGTVSDHVDNEDGTQDWTFTRLAANGGAMSGGTVIAADAIVLDYGVAGNGWYEVSAVDGAYGLNAPYAQVVTWDDDSPAETSTLRARLGNLRGITSIDNEFGLLAGNYAVTGGQYFRASNEAFELHGVDLSMWNGSTEVIRLDRTAPSFALGATLPSGYGSGTGIWMGLDSGAMKFRAGVPGGNGIFWDGTKLTWTAANTTLDASGNLTATSATLSGSVTATSGAIGGWTLGSTSLTAGSGSTRVGLDSGGTNPAIYAGSATPGSAPFRVTNTGALTATSATITGAITATSGSVTGAFTVGTGGSISSGATSFSAGTGYWFDYNSGTPRFRIGNPGGDRFLWDGDDIELVTDKVRIESGEGIELDASGDSFRNAYKFSDNSRMYSSSGDIVVYGDDTLTLQASGTQFLVANSSSVNAGGVQWSFFGRVYVDEELAIGTPPTTTADANPLVYASGFVTEKTDGVTGTQICAFQGVHHITIESGIVTQVTCLAEPAPSAEYASLREEVATLRAQLNLLLASMTPATFSERTVK